MLFFIFRIPPRPNPPKLEICVGGAFSVIQSVVEAAMRRVVQRAMCCLSSAACPYSRESKDDNDNKDDEEEEEDEDDDDAGGSGTAILPKDGDIRMMPSDIPHFPVQQQQHQHGNIVSSDRSMDGWEETLHAL